MIQIDLYFSAWSRSRLFLPGADPIRLKPEFRDLGLPEPPKKVAAPQHLNIQVIYKLFII